MGKRYFVVVLIVFSGLFAFADNGEQEEVDFLLFLPNSAEGFVDEARAMIQLDTIAKYLLGKNPGPGQIYVYGYTANVVNDIDSVNLSRARALLVINELQKRGIARELFSDPVAYGGVELWGGNEEDRVLNRRVRIILEGAVLTPAVIEPVVSETEPEPEPEQKPAEPEPIMSAADGTVQQEAAKEKSGSKFPWLLLLLLLLLLAALLFLLSKLRRKNKEAEPAAAPRPAPVIEKKPVIVPVVAAAVAGATEMTVNLDEEIRFRSYELYLRRYGQNEDEINDWYTAVAEICNRYDASGYRTYHEGGSWWASKTLQIKSEK